jgi:hypothetical protein
MIGITRVPSASNTGSRSSSLTVISVALLRQFRVEAIHETAIHHVSQTFTDQTDDSTLTTRTCGQDTKQAVLFLRGHHRTDVIFKIGHVYLLFRRAMPFLVK